MKSAKNSQGKRGITRYSKKTERVFFFYATLAMFVCYVLSWFLGQ